MANAPHILIVDDHREIRDLVSRTLTKEGFRVSVAADGRGMRKTMSDSRIDLILLDLMLPGEDGLSLCRSVRAGSRIPVIMLTAKGDEVDRVIGLEMGADDYLPKPFGSRELVARIKAVLRRSQHTSSAKPSERPKQYHFDRWRLDIGARELLREDGVILPLSTGEYDLLIALVERPQRVLSRDQLLDLARGRAANAFDRSIDTQVSRLRKKLEQDPERSEDHQDGLGWRLHVHASSGPGMSRLFPQELVRPDPAHSAGRACRVACRWLLDLYRRPRAGRARCRWVCNRPAHSQPHPLGPGYTARDAATPCRCLER